MTTDLDAQYVYEGIDHDYIDRAATAIADEMNAGRPVEIRYEPGDMTSYGLVLVDLNDLSLVEIPRGGWPGSRVFRGVGDGDGWFLLMWEDHGSVVLEWGSLPVAGYLASKLDNCPPVSAKSIVLLLDAIRRWRGIE
jgi:hypothetical protein